MKCISNNRVEQTYKERKVGTLLSTEMEVDKYDLSTLKEKNR